MYSLTETLHCHRCAKSLLVCREGKKSGMFGEKVDGNGAGGERFEGFVNG